MIKKCQRCKKRKRIYAKKKCISCYQYSINLKNTNSKLNTKKWREKNKDYWKEYRTIRRVAKEL